MRSREPRIQFLYNVGLQETLCFVLGEPILYWYSSPRDGVMIHHIEYNPMAELDD